MIALDFKHHCGKTLKAHQIFSTNKVRHDSRKVLTYTDKIMTHGSKNETIMEQKRQAQYFIVLSIPPVSLCPFKKKSLSLIHSAHIVRLLSPVQYFSLSFLLLRLSQKPQHGGGGSVGATLSFQAWVSY